MAEELTKAPEQLDEPVGNYLMKLWNGKYGNTAAFIVQRVKDGMFTEYHPSRPKDVSWVAEDLTQLGEYKTPEWQDFHDEPVEDIEEIVF